jgi:hypothetical protein
MSKPIVDSGIGMDATLSGLKQRGYVPRVVYDVGAADGSWTRQAMTYWPDSTYVCFEPLAERKKESGCAAGIATHPDIG